MYESIRLLTRSYLDAFSNIVVSVILGLIIVYAGYVVAGLEYR